MSIGMDDEYSSGPSIQDDVEEVEDGYSSGQSIQDNNDSDELEPLGPLELSAEAERNSPRVHLTLLPIV
jgi:hypothetical protein